MPLPSQPTIFAVIVVYKMLPEDSPSLQSLLAAKKPETLQLKILVVDNTPGGQSPGWLPEGVVYESSPTNPGLADAYNRAIRHAVGGGFSWLLTLDQDTYLPSNFVTLLTEALIRNDEDARIGALVGRIFDRGRQLSPLRFAGGFWPRFLPANFVGLAPAFTTALNSASLLRISGLEAIGGYDPRFPLNNSDTSLFHRLGEAGLRVFVVPGLVIRHQLAIMQREERMTPERYQHLLADERAFWDLYMGTAARAERLFKLMGRLAKDLLTGKNKSTRCLTWNEICFRLFSLRRNRLRNWRKQNTSGIRSLESSQSANEGV